MRRWCYFAYTIVPPINMIEPWFLYTGFFLYDIIELYKGVSR
nr:MAG TPA: hypothetical protein [Caudoviricetes sp.]